MTPFVITEDERARISLAEINPPNASRCLTHWPLRDVAVILSHQFVNSVSYDICSISCGIALKGMPLDFNDE